ncbi:MAG: LamG domain-containing protein [Planctomycetaceae bacterium]|nr:LamG domain-containing protein [Planctomycetaceae bacterium]
MDSSKAPYLQKRGFAVRATANVMGDGVIAAQGGSNHGWSLYVQQGKLCFATTRGGKQTLVNSDTEIEGNVTVVATLRKSGQLKLSVNGAPVTQVKLDGCLTDQPLEPLEVGMDSDGVVGKYESPYALKGNVEKLIIDIP